jgi:hypothetical protein
VAIAERTRADVERVKRRDADFGATQDLFLGRMRNTLMAVRAHGCRQPGTVFELRQSLVDLAAVSEALGDDISQPLT